LRVVFSTVVLALVWAGASTAGHPLLSLTEYARRANAICLAAGKTPSPDPFSARSPSARKQALRKLHEQDQKLLANLATLRAEEKVHRRAQAWLAAFGADLRAAERAYIATPSSTDSIARSLRAHHRADTLGQALGINACTDPATYTGYYRPYTLIAVRAAFRRYGLRFPIRTGLMATATQCLPRSGWWVVSARTWTLYLHRTEVGAERQVVCLRKQRRQPRFLHDGNLIVFLTSNADQRRLRHALADLH
jgi:hypothetical protein